MGDKSIETIRVLVGDDDPTILRLIETGLPLAAPDIEIVGTAQGPDTLEESARELRPDLIMVDHYLDTANGLDLGRALRQLDFAPVLVLWTGTKSNDLDRNAAEAGFSTVVEKSADLEGLAATIREAVTP